MRTSRNVLVTPFATLVAISGSLAAEPCPQVGEQFPRSFAALDQARLRAPGRHTCAHRDFVDVLGIRSVDIYREQSPPSGFF